MDTSKPVALGEVKSLFDPEWLDAVSKFDYAFHKRAKEVKQDIKLGGALAMKLAGVA